jgi:hypothetical protein
MLRLAVLFIGQRRVKGMLRVLMDEKPNGVSNNILLARNFLFHSVHYLLAADSVDLQKIN